MSIEIKNPDVLRRLMYIPYHHILIDIICWAAEYYGLLMTEADRDPRHPGDVHATNPGRACDLRFRIYPRKVAYEIMDKINNTWCYDPSRTEKQCVMIHDSGNGIHFHIQVHDSTVLRAINTKEPDIQSKIKEADRKRLAKEITEQQYIDLLDRLAHEYDVWLKRDE